VRLLQEASFSFLSLLPFSQPVSVNYLVVGILALKEFVINEAVVLIIPLKDYLGKCQKILKK
jgi:hypothetical protein